MLTSLYLPHQTHSSFLFWSDTSEDTPIILEVSVQSLHLSPASEKKIKEKSLIPAGASDLGNSLEHTDNLAMWLWQRKRGHSRGQTKLGLCLSSWVNLHREAQGISTYSCANEDSHILFIDVRWKDGNEIILQKLYKCMDCCCSSTGHLHRKMIIPSSLKLPHSPWPLWSGSCWQHTGRQVWTVSNGDFKGRAAASLSYCMVVFQEEHILPAYPLQQAPSGSSPKWSLTWLLVSKIIPSAICNHWNLIKP